MADKNYYDMVCIIRYENINHKNKTVKLREQTLDFRLQTKKLEINLVERTLIFNNVTKFRIYLLMN